MKETGSAPGSPPPTTACPPAAVAVIDIGASAVRLVIAEVGAGGEFQVLESLHQTVALASDTFASGSIGRTATEECVEAVRRFQQKIEEYGITDSRNIRAVATTAVREAENREAFLDRLYVATGIPIQILEEVDVARLTYVAVMPFLHANPELLKGDTIVVEVGAGMTELILFRNGIISFSGAFRIGALRMREMFEDREGPGERIREIIETHIRRPVQELRKAVPVETEPRIVALGGDVRFAASQAKSDRAGAALRLKVSALGSLADSLLPLTVDELVARHKLTFVEAQTLTPALQIYLHLAKAFRAKELLVPEISLRDGVVREMAPGLVWSDEFRAQIVKSALEIGRKYQFDEAHACHVAELSAVVFEALRSEHRLGEQHLLLLRIAAILHDIGLFVSTKSHHKHSFYLILNSDLFGLDRRSVELIALVARYHRRASPKAEHELYPMLNREERILLAKLAAILRVADSLDRTHTQKITTIRCALPGDGRFVLTIPGARDLTIEQVGMKRKGKMFEEVYGLTPVLKRSSS